MVFFLNFFFEEVLERAGLSGEHERQGSLVVARAHNIEQLHAIRVPPREQKSGKLLQETQIVEILEALEGNLRGLMLRAATIRNFAKGASLIKLLQRGRRPRHAHRAAQQGKGLPVELRAVWKAILSLPRRPRGSGVSNRTCKKSPDTATR